MSHLADLGVETHHATDSIDDDVPEGRGADEVHLVRDARNNVHYGINQPNEWFCNVCRCRVTVTPERLEVGHHSDCPYRSDDLPAGNSRGKIVGRINRVCPVCGEKEGDHRDECPKEGHVCPTCERDGFASRRAMKYHHSRVHGESLKDHSCSNCGKAFAVDRSDQKYCSHECVSEAQRKRETRECEFCGDDFETRPHMDTRFCSHTCASKGYAVEHRTGEVRTCEECGEEFYRHPSEEGPFCSSECFVASGREMRHCEQCGDSFSVQKKSSKRFCCHECSHEWLSKSQRDRQRVDCKNCGADIFRQRSSNRKFCDRECYLAYRRSDSDGGDA